MSNALAQRIEREDLSLCRLVEIILPDGIRTYYTDLSSDIVYDGKTYLADPGVDVSSIRQSMTGAASSCNVIVAYDETKLTEQKVRYGIVDNARVIISVLDYLAIFAGPTVIFTGRATLAELNEKNTCNITFDSSAVDSSGATIGEVYSQRCRNIFGDRRCKIDLEALKVPFTVIRAAGNNMSFVIGNAGDFPPEDPDEEVIPFVGENGETIYNTVGEFEFEIRPSHTLVIEMLSSSGGSGSSVQNALDFRVQSYLDGFDGGDAEPTSFGAYILPGGKAGKGGEAHYVPNDFRLGIPALTFLNKSRLYKPITPMLGPKDLDNLKPLFAEVYPNMGAPSALGLPYVGIPQSEGGDSGAGHKGVIRIDMSAAGAPEVGSKIVVKIGKPGIGGGFDGTPGGNWMEGVDGSVGSVKVTWASNNEIIEEAEAIKLKPYSIGTVDWTEGNNAGYSNQIADKDEGLVILMNPTVRDIRAGDKGFIKPGCSNYADMCEEVWNNLRNMQAEPAVPQGQSTAPIPVAPPAVDGTKPPQTGLQLDPILYDENGNAIPGTGPGFNFPMA